MKLDVLSIATSFRRPGYTATDSFWDTMQLLTAIWGSGTPQRA